MKLFHSFNVKSGWKSMRRTLFTASALLSVGGLFVISALPANMTMPFAEDSAGSVQMQSLISADSEMGMKALAVFSEVGAETAPLKTVGSNGLFDSRLLTNTKLRYPFDRQVALTDGFGYRAWPVAGFHNAQDLDAGEGTTIRIIGDGIVTQAELPGWCGTGLEVQHKVDGEDVSSLYCHMQTGSHSYQVGDLVRAGDEAGRVGNTGQSYGAHLHLVLRVNGEPVDPLPFIAKHSI